MVPIANVAYFLINFTALIYFPFSLYNWEYFLLQLCGIFPVQIIRNVFFGVVCSLLFNTTTCKRKFYFLAYSFIGWRLWWVASIDWLHVNWKSQRSIFSSVDQHMYIPISMQHLEINLPISNLHCCLLLSIILAIRVVFGSTCLVNGSRLLSPSIIRLLNGLKLLNPNTV